MDAIIWVFFGGCLVGFLLGMFCAAMLTMARLDEEE